MIELAKKKSMINRIITDEKKAALSKHCQTTSIFYAAMLERIIRTLART
jgi:hypothetical protein